jgi:hypothetical protein
MLFSQVKVINIIGLHSILNMHCIQAILIIINHEYIVVIDPYSYHHIITLVSGREARGAMLGRHGDVVNSSRRQRGVVAHRGGCSTALGGQPEGIGVEGVASYHWWPGVGAKRRSVPGRCSGWRRRGWRRTGAGWRHGGPRRWWRSSGSTLR